MIMEGLETLVAPSHHAFLLTESAAAAHFNVLSFDTCLLKTAATTAPLTANNNNLFTNNNNHSISASNTATSQQQQSSQTAVHLSNQHHLHQHHQAQTHHHQTLTSNSTITTSSHPHLNILPSIGSGIQHGHSRASAEGNQITEIQTGDLNTPVTTASDIPSFFGPSTVVEPPPISGKYTTIINRTQQT